jgi:hypothetical protein
MKKNKLGRVLITIFASTLFAHCSPKIYLIDRQTVLEEEAAGEWPEFEKEWLEKSKSQGPTPFPKAEMNARDRRHYHVLNGELVCQGSCSSKE